MPYYDTLAEDLDRAQQILDKGAIYGGDSYAAFELLKSFVAELTRQRGASG